jgi:hypothetical protein
MIHTRIEMHCCSKRPSSHFDLAFQPQDNPVKHIPSTAMRLGQKYIIHSIVCQCIKTSKQHKSGEQCWPQYHGFSSYKNGKRNESQTTQNPPVFICGDHGPSSFHSRSLCLCPDLLPGHGLDYDSGAAPFHDHLYPYSCFPSHGRPCHDPGSSLCLPFHRHSHSCHDPCSSLCLPFQPNLQQWNGTDSCYYKTKLTKNYGPGLEVLCMKSMLLFLFQRQWMLKGSYD